MDSTRLLERIRHMGRSPHWQGNFDIEILQDSILRHLSQVLNARQGSAIISQEFGIPDFSTFTAAFDSKDIKRMEQNLHTVITRYEKRLKNLSITFAPSPDRPLSLLFHIEGEVAGHHQKTNISFQTILSSQGRVTIEAFQADTLHE